MIKVMLDKLKVALLQREKLRLNDANLIPSAVLVPIYLKEGEFFILFTKRTERVRVHKGQISFPGGAYRKSDKTLLNTALRESAEEIGLEPSRVEMLGELDDTATVTSEYLISPFVGLIPWPYKFKLDRREVEEIIEAPISALMDKNCLEVVTKRMEGRELSFYYYHYQGRIIWGATAAILKQFLDIFRSLT